MTTRLTKCICDSHLLVPILITVWKKKDKERRQSSTSFTLTSSNHLFFLKFFSRNDTNRRWPNTPCIGFREAQSRKHISIVQIKITSLHKHPLAYTNWRSNESYFRRRKVLISGPSIGQRTVDLPSDAIRYGTRARNWIWVWTQMNLPTHLYSICMRHMSRALLCFYASVGQRSSTTVLEGQVPHGSLTESALLASTANYRNQKRVNVTLRRDIGTACIR